MKSGVMLFLFITNLVALEIPVINIESTKLTETSLDAPQSIDVIDEDKLETLQVDSIDDLSSVLSNTNISGLGNSSDKTFTIRGISNYLTYESSVAMYIDDTPVPFSYGYGVLDFKNIKSIEVLKGPQGTQFGKNAGSGVINIYTKEPTNKFTNEVSLGYSTYNSKDIYARVSGPLNNKDLSFGASITKSTSDGYTKSNTSN